MTWIQVLLLRNWYGKSLEGIKSQTEKIHIVDSRTAVQGANRATRFLCLYLRQDKTGNTTGAKITCWMSWVKVKTRIIVSSSMHVRHIERTALREEAGAAAPPTPSPPLQHHHHQQTSPFVSLFWNQRNLKKSEHFKPQSNPYGSVECRKNLNNSFLGISTNVVSL